jgi:Flp pilus assembly protein TadD
MTRHREAEALFHAGTRLMDDDAGAAERSFRQALALNPDIPELHANLALLLERCGRTDEAERHYRCAMALHPSLTQASLNLGVMLDRQRRVDEAESVYRQALSRNPASAPGWSNLGVLLAGLKREEEAEQCHRQALALDPGYGKAAFNLAYLLLRQGRYAEGWERLESRQWYLPLQQLLPCPRWHGEPLQGKALLIGLEAGHGDMIQFCRYASLAKQAGAARVGILCHPALKNLLAGHRDLDAVIAADEPFATDGWDYWSPPLSLPFLFKTRLDSIPADLPYLTVQAERMAHGPHPPGEPDGRLRVGLVWRGNPNFENDGERSLPSLATLAPLGSLPHVHFFSLQKGAGEDEAAHPPASLSVTDLAPQIGDFADSAAIISKLDLVITVDTAVAHLAGALGRRCWVLLPDYKPDWRWLAGRDDSPWYPGVMRLFRQDATGAWDPVIAAIKRQLSELSAQRP